MARNPTPVCNTQLQENEIFVFGSNLYGMHGGGAARTAHQQFGAEWGVGVGPTGKCYAIPTMHGGIDTIKPYVDDFITYAKEHTNQHFYVTRIGCGIAGYNPGQIAPHFKNHPENVILPEAFIKALK